MTDSTMVVIKLNFILKIILTAYKVIVITNNCFVRNKTILEVKNFTKMALKIMTSS